MFLLFFVQHHIYSCISSDPGEEKLDASQFQNDWDFQNNCNIDPLAPPVGEDKTHTVASAGSGDKSKSRTKEKRLNVSNCSDSTVEETSKDSNFIAEIHWFKNLPSTQINVLQLLYTFKGIKTNLLLILLQSSKLSTTQSYVDDSDSDLEDIHYVIVESCKAIKFTENTLKKFRKDNMETGIFIDPSEYVCVKLGPVCHLFVDCCKSVPSKLILNNLMELLGGCVFGK